MSRTEVTDLADECKVLCHDKIVKVARKNPACPAYRQAGGRQV
jgi:hypothetical protein